MMHICIRVAAIRNFVSLAIFGWRACVKILAL
jgi:hypothetical protein